VEGGKSPHLGSSLNGKIDYYKRVGGSSSTRFLFACSFAASIIYANQELGYDYQYHPLDVILSVGQRPESKDLQRLAIASGLKDPSASSVRLIKEINRYFPTTNYE
jgi:hypothetical protein